MKWLSAILSIYVVLLVSMPCADGKARDFTPITEQETSGHNHHDEATDGCSPFCFCSCCSISVILSDIEYNCVPEDIKIFTFFTDYKSPVTRFIPPVWEPPRSL